jgi:RimJ/RimL family protein N-acetyltransferase
MPPVREIARRLGRTRIILWGGVMIENARARAFYRRAGFRPVGEFVNSDGVASVDMMMET